MPFVWKTLIIFKVEHLSYILRDYNNLVLSHSHNSMYQIVGVSRKKAISYRELM